MASQNDTPRAPPQTPRPARTSSPLHRAHPAARLGTRPDPM